LLLDEIPEGLREVDFFEKMFESEISKNKQIVIANLGPTWDCQIWTWDCRIWILGMWMVPYPVLIRAATSKNIYIRLASRFPNKSNIYNIYIYIYPGMGVPYIS